MFINLSSETFVNKKKVSMCKAVFPPLNLREGVRKKQFVLGLWVGGGQES